MINFPVPVSRGYGETEYTLQDVFGYSKFLSIYLFVLFIYSFIYLFVYLLFLLFFFFFSFFLFFTFNILGFTLDIFRCSQIFAVDILGFAFCPLDIFFTAELLCFAFDIFGCNRFSTVAGAHDHGLLTVDILSFTLRRHFWLQNFFNYLFIYLFYLGRFCLPPRQCFAAVLFHCLFRCRQSLGFSFDILGFALDSSPLDGFGCSRV